MHSRLQQLTLLPLLFLALSPQAVPGATETATAVPENDPQPFLRGMTVSCPGYGQIWGSQTMVETLEELEPLGVDWVAIHPYASVDTSGRVRFTPAQETGYLPRAVDIAKKAGVKLFWKPHLAYWGSFEWRGSIAFGDNEVRWRRFFDSYRAFIVDQARFAEASGIPLLAVGLEYEMTTPREAEWRRIIAEVRKVYSGRITYSANWDRLDQVPFWDALDSIGVQAYFPLSQEMNPSTETLQRGWDTHLESLRQLSTRYDKPVLFAEIGYDVSPEAARSPWQRKSQETPENRALQRRLMEVALERIEAVGFIEGMFWWKWIPGQRHGGDFSMRHHEPRLTLEKSWGKNPFLRIELGN